MSSSLANRSSTRAELRRTQSRAGDGRGEEKQAQEIYLGLQIMEAAAIEVLNEKKDAE
jgi:hypothetical protein